MRRSNPGPVVVVLLVAADMLDQAGGDAPTKTGLRPSGKQLDADPL